MLQAKWNPDNGNAEEQTPEEMSKEDPEAAKDNPDDIEGEKETTTGSRARSYFLTKGGKAQNGQLKALNTPRNSDYSHAKGNSS